MNRTTDRREQFEQCIHACDDSMYRVAFRLTGNHTLARELITKESKSPTPTESFADLAYNPTTEQRDSQSHPCPCRRRPTQPQTMNDSPDSPNPLSDSQLDAALRDVAVPESLVADLLTIPDQVQSTDHAAIKTATTSSGLQPWRRAMTACLVASFAAIALFGWWKFQSGDKPGNTLTPSIVTPSIVAQSTPNPVTPDAPPTEALSAEEGALLAELKALESEFEYVLAGNELAKVESSIADHERTLPISLSRHEVLSITHAVADQTPAELGSSSDDVISDMQNVIETFPNTRGAKIAREFIEQTTENESERTKS